MDQLTEEGDISVMMDPVEIASSEMNSVNSVQDRNHKTIHDQEKRDSSVGDPSRCITPEQKALSKNDSPLFEKPSYGTAQEPAFLAATHIEDYSDVSSCSEADFSWVFNVFENNPTHSSECPNPRSMRDENELKKDEIRKAWPSAKAKATQDYACGAASETGGERQSGSVNDVIDGGNQREKSLNCDYQCSNLSTTEGEMGCPLKTEEQKKGEFLIQNDDGVGVKSKGCEDTTTNHKNLVCAFDLNDSKQSDEKIAVDAGNTGVQNDCHLKGINHTCVTKNHGVQNTGYDEMTDDWSKRSQEVEHSSFEFLHSCFGLSSLYNAKLDHSAADLSRSMTHSSQKSVVNYIQPSDSLSTTPVSKPRGQIKEAADNFLQKSGQQNDTFTDKIIPGLASTESTNDTRIKNSGSFLSSKSLLRKLQPVVLVKTNNRNASNGNMYVCSLCQNNAHKLDELIEHHHCKHSNHMFQYCLTCGAYFSNGSLAAHVCEQNGQNHMQLSHAVSPTQKPTERFNAKYLCKYCKKPFVKMSYYQDHEQRHRTVTSHRCPCCGLYFPNAKKLAAHKRKVKCFPLILEPNKQRNKSLETNPNNPAKPIFSSGIDGCQIGLHDCFVKLVDINKKKPFPQKISCPVCGKTFKLRAQLKVHLRSHSDSKPFKCNKCKKVFKYSWNLEKHKKEPCSGHITKQQLEPPTSSRFPGRFACPTCPQILRYSYNRTRHMRQRCLKEYMQMGKGKVGNRYKCPLCNETFSLAANRNRHIKNTCFQQYKLQGKIGKQKLVKENVKEEKEEKQVLPSENLPCYNCNVCQASFACKSGYHRHMNKHSLLNCSTEEVDEHDNPTDAKGTESSNERLQTQESSRQTSSDMDTDQTVLCRFCDKCFSSSDSLTNHLQIHVGKKPFCCLDCGKNFGRRGHLIAHKNVHKRRIQCSVCKKIVPTIGDLLKHRQSHIKKGMLQCPDCPMQFKFPVFLLRHVATHAKKAMPKSSLPAEPAPTKSANEIVKEFKESFVCGICKKTFVDSKTMSDHCLTHLPKPSVSQCPVCKHSFTSRIALIRHIRLHTGEKPFPCKSCGMRFRRKEALKLHERKCKGLQEQPLHQSTQTQAHEKHDVKAESKCYKVPKKFACSYCPHIFKMSGHLKMHEKAHLANNLVPCSQCGKYYKKNKIYGHRKHCKTKESSAQPNNSDDPQNAHTSESKDGFTSRTSRKKERSKDMVTYIKDHLKEQCPHCSKRFQFRSYLLRHLSTHFRKKLFSCEHCGQKYGSQSSCQEHEALCDGVMKQHEAKRLNESEEAKIISNSASSLKDCTVIIGENGKQFKCNFCTKTFTKSRNLRRHILTHTEVKPYRCKTCENCFSRYDHLKFHQIRCRGKKQHLQQIPIDHFGSQSKAQPQSYVFECSSCSIKFSTHTDLTRHFSKLHSSFKPFSCKRCGAGFTSKDSLRRHCIRVNCQMSSTECLEPVQVPTKLSTSVQSCRETSKLMQRIEGHYSSKWKFQCEYCPRRFKTQSQLKLHTRLHTGEKPFACSSCDERFIRKDYLKRHFGKCTGKREGPKVLCDRCGGLFTQEALEVHQNNCIVSLKPTDCATIGSNISSPLKVNAFSCANCNDRFLLYSQLQQHILTKHRSDGFQQSSVLEYEQLSSNLLIKEEPVDDNYAENMICHNQKYVNNGHENTEGNIKKPYECDQCNLRFITNSGLGMHMRTHRKIYPLSCHRCNKGFWSKNVQQKHMKKCKGLQVTKKDPNTKDTTSSELEYTPTDNILVFNKGSNTTGTGVLQTQFSCKDQDKGNMDKGDAVVHKYQCSECDQSFTDGLMLISHLEAHGREDHERRLGKSHRCHICGKTFDQASVLQRHMKTQHQEAVKNTCPECFRSFRYPSDLDIHRSCHDLNRPFVCNTCELRFWTSKSLITHQRLSHLDNEPLKTIEPTLKTDRVSPKVFTCNPCNKVYTIKKSYMKHCRIKHKGSSECLDHLRSTTTEHQLSNNESDGSDDKDVSDNDSDSAPYFPCHVCGKTFLTSENLEDHQRCHLGEKPYECEECGKCFVQLVNLQQHQRSHKSEFQCQMCAKGFVSLFALRKHKHTHVRKRPHRCTKCHLTFTQSSQLTEHMITHRDENFPCDLCHENFSCKSSRAEHRKIHTEAEELPPLIPPAKQNSSPLSINSSSRTVQQYRYRCEICHTRFPDPEQLSEHGCNPAKERPYSCKDCNQHFLHGAHLKKHQLTHQLSGTRSFQCNNCHMSFSHRSHFLRHLQTHGGEESSKSQIDDAEKIVNTDDSSHDKIYKCPICPESFSQVLELANHLSVHANMCNVCNKTFSTKQQLEKHEQCHLSAATQYECTECGKSFIGSDAFRQHYCGHQKRFSCSSSTTDKKRCLENSSELFANEDEEEVDVGEDFYNCPTCNKRFSSNISLEEHQKLHEFGRPFKCLVCGKGFAKKKYLAQHQQIHNERPYQCDLCSNSFKSEQSLLSHRKSHNALRKYHCSVCDKSYRTPYDLSRHEQKHPELQTFSGAPEYHRCDMCYKSFSLLTQLRQHQETHVGQVVYECTECDKAFAFLHLLKEHQQTHGTSTDSFQSQSPADILFQSPVIE